MSAGDWTSGQAALAYGHCTHCDATWYFRRDFCPRCGAPGPERLVASGRGHVYAATTVSRAPTAELRALAPYRIVLVDAAEGFRMMAHAAPDVAIGDAVRTRFVPFGALTIPYCEREGESQ
jgi:uncharacterized OB-fold protein